MMKLTLILISFAFAMTAQAAGTAAAPAVAKGSQILISGADGKTHFLAVGRPAMIKIRGEGHAPIGSLTINGHTVSGRLKFHIDDISTGIDMRDHHMKEKYLETAKFPDALLEITKAEIPGDWGKLSAEKTDIPFTGNFTLHGETHPVDGTFDVKSSGAKVAVEARFKVKITEYKIDIPTYAGVKVADDVEVSTAFEVPQK